MTILYISHRLHEIFEIGDRVTVLRDGQLVATRPLAGLTIPEIVRMMVGRSIKAEHAFREDVLVCGRGAAGRGPAAQREDAPRCRFSVGRARSSASRGW